MPFATVTMPGCCIMSYNYVQMLVQNGCPTIPHSANERELHKLHYEAAAEMFGSFVTLVGRNLQFVPEIKREMEKLSLDTLRYPIG